MKKALDGYVDISSLTNVQKDCLIAIAQANGYDTTTNNQERTTLALYSELDYCLAQTLSMGIEQFALRSRPIISIEDFLKFFAPEWATGVCTNEDWTIFWWVDDKDTYQAVDNGDAWKFSDTSAWKHLQERQLFSFKDFFKDVVAKTGTIGDYKINVNVIPADKLVGATMTLDQCFGRHTSRLESYKDFCKNFGGSVSVNDEYYTYYTDGDEYYEFTSLEAFEGFLRDYEGFFDKYSGNMQR